MASLPNIANIRALATELGRPYRQVLTAALFDSWYLTPADDKSVRPYGEVVHDAIAALTEAQRLTNRSVRQTSSGQWEPDADPRSAMPIDWAEFVTLALAGTAANAGGIVGRSRGEVSTTLEAILAKTLSGSAETANYIATEPIPYFSTKLAEASNGPPMRLRPDSGGPHCPVSVQLAVFAINLALAGLTANSQSNWHLQDDPSMSACGLDARSHGGALPFVRRGFTSQHTLGSTHSGALSRTISNTSR